MNKIAVVIPSYRCSQSILRVLSAIPTVVSLVFVVDDACPESTGALVERDCRDERVRVIRHPENRGVGAAVRTGYRAALDHEADIVVKIDGDACARGRAEKRPGRIENGNRMSRSADSYAPPNDDDTNGKHE